MSDIVNLVLIDELYVQDPWRIFDYLIHPSTPVMQKLICSPDKTCAQLIKLLLVTQRMRTAAYLQCRKDSYLSSSDSTVLPLY